MSEERSKLEPVNSEAFLKRYNELTEDVSDSSERELNSGFWLRHTERYVLITQNKEFDPGSGRTLAARLTHASRTEMRQSLLSCILVADG